MIGNPSPDRGDGRYSFERDSTPNSSSVTQGDAAYSNYLSTVQMHPQDNQYSGTIVSSLKNDGHYLIPNDMQLVQDSNAFKQQSETVCEILKLANGQEETLKLALSAQAEAYRYFQELIRLKSKQVEMEMVEKLTAAGRDPSVVFLHTKNCVPQGFNNPNFFIEKTEALKDTTKRNMKDIGESAAKSISSKPLNIHYNKAHSDDNSNLAIRHVINPSLATSQLADCAPSSKENELPANTTIEAPNIQNSGYANASGKSPRLNQYSQASRESLRVDEQQSSKESAAFESEKSASASPRLTDSDSQKQAELSFHYYVPQVDHTLSPKPSVLGKKSYSKPPPAQTNARKRKARGYEHQASHVRHKSEGSVLKFSRTMLPEDFEMSTKLSPKVEIKLSQTENKCEEKIAESQQNHE